MDWLEPLKSSGNLRRAGVRALGVVGASQLLKLVINVAGTLWLVRLLAPEAFGFVAMAALLINFILLFKDFGLGTATIQTSRISQRQASTIFWLGQFGGMLFMVFGLAAAPFFAWLFQSPQLTPAFMLLSFGFVLNALSMQHTALLSRNLRFATLGLVEITALLAGLATAVLMARAGYDWWSLIWQRMVQLGCLTVGAWIACSWRPSAEFDLTGARSQVAFGLHVAGSNLAGYASRNTDNLLIGWYWGAAPLGFYSKAYDLLMAPLSQIATPLAQALQPILARLRDDPERYRTLLVHSFSMSLLILLPIGTLMAWQSSTVTLVLLGDPWLSAAPVVGWFGFLVCFHLCGSVLNLSLVSRQRGADLSRTTLVNAVINVCGFIASVSFGIAAVAATYTLLGALFRTPYLIYVSTGDEFFPRVAAVRALVLPAVTFVILSAFHWMFAVYSDVASLSTWQTLLLQLIAGYVILLLIVMPTSLGRFILQAGRMVGHPSR